MATDLQEDVDLLRNVPLFRNLDAAKLKLLAFTSERLTYSAGESLFNQGDSGDTAYVIVQGEADIIIDTPAGPITVATVKQNDWVGEIAILCDVPRTATITAKSKLITLRISKDVFFQLVMQFPQMSVEVMRELAFRLERTNRKLQEAVGKLKEAGG
ncbi:MAG: putative NTE family protein [Alphaproteobacteria bacterium MarineAlpha10_Bin2]|nr:MAG: putative NTE family protein [Alphaproteobacteria bacterium MarineAlpha10_Bin2]